MGLMSPADAVFLLAESREHPMHVAGLQIFRKPPDAGEDYVNHLYEKLLTFGELRPLMRRRPRDPVSTVGQTWWTDDTEVDLEHHVRLLALPRPGRVRELLALVSRLHSYLLDRHRPLWEFHLIDGLEGGRFATYVKIHHALADGVSAVRLMTGALPEDAETTVPPLWAPDPADDGARPPASRTGWGPLRAVGSTVDAMGDLAGAVPSLLRLGHAAVRGRTTLPSFPAPRTMFNVPITGSRRIAAQAWPIDRLRAAGKQAGATLNDVVLAMCAGALRRYLIAQDELPDRALVAGVPVSLRAKSASGDQGNAVGIALCGLATDLPDPGERLREITLSMRQAKQTMSGQTPLRIQAASAALLAPTVLASLPGGATVAPPAFNLIISNVPGPRRPRYWNGALMEGTYPISIPYEGMALNITVFSYAGDIGFGLIGCRRSVPHLQHLLRCLEESLAELETAH
jgi:WS/DGAT/MGAT family acyltransferase